VQESVDLIRIAERRIELVDPLPEDEVFLAGLGIKRGERFPDLALRSTSDEPATLHGVLDPNRKTLLNVWATWCVPCAKEIPELQRLYPELERAGIDLVGVSVDLDTVEHVPGYIAERNVTYPIYTTDEAALETLYPRGEATVPLTLLLDGAGRILEIHSGWNDASEKALRDLMTRKGG
jgi:peroxiredoxin